MGPPEGLRVWHGFDSIFDMSQPLKPARSGPPHNPGIRELVAGKRRASPADLAEQARAGFRGWHERGYLPHRDEPGLIQFVTFRLVDSFPESLRSEWEHFATLENDRRRLIQLEAYLDKGRGACYLRHKAVAELVETNLRKFAGDPYELRSWVIMPNHVHVLFKVGSLSMSDMVGECKKHTGRQANKILDRVGPFWAEGYFDVFMRDAEHERRTIRYIENNPAKARLVGDPKDWPWGSARLRDQYGRLLL